MTSESQCIQTNSLFSTHQSKSNSHVIATHDNSQEVARKSTEELLYHCKLLDAFELDSTHKVTVISCFLVRTQHLKVQLHVGGMYGNKPEAIQRFIERYKELHPSVKLVILLQR